jgi:hypothetical protein
VRRHRQRDAVEVAVAEDLDQLARADRTGGDELVDADRAALGEQLGEVADVDDLVTRPGTGS